MGNTKPSLPVPISPEDLESQDFRLESLSLQKECDEKLAPEVVMALKKITYYVSQVGFSVEEACQLSNIDFEKFSLLCETEPLVKKVIVVKELEYKKALMHTVSARARDGDDKLAQWLLERRFPEEFATAKKSGGNGLDGKDILFEAIEFIQRSGDRQPLVHEQIGRRVAVSVSSPKPGGIKEKILAIKNILV